MSAPTTPGPAFANIHGLIDAIDMGWGIFINERRYSNEQATDLTPHTLLAAIRSGSVRIAAPSIGLEDDL